MQHVVFVSRKGSGTGGMQQLTKDLSRMIESLYPTRTTSVISHSKLGTFALPLRVLLQSRHADIIHFADGALSPIAWILKKIYPAKRISLTACGLDITHQPKWYQYMMRRALSAFDAIACISNKTAEEVIVRIDDPAKVHTIPCGIWDEYSVKDVHNSSPILLTVGRLIPRKGVAWFMENVLPQLVKQYPTLQYHIAGDGPDRSRIEKLAETLGLLNCVVMHGKVNEAERNMLYGKADLFIMPNIVIEGDIEGFGIVAIEASASGVPVAAAHCEGVADAVNDGMTGRHFSSGNAQEALELIVDLLENPMDRNAVAKSTIAQYSWKRLAQLYERYIFTGQHRHNHMGLHWRSRQNHAMDSKHSVAESKCACTDSISTR